MDRIEDPRLQIIGQEWKSRCRELADWAFERLVNRKDVWGQYTGPKPGGKGYGALTLPQKSMRGKDMVTLDKISRHFGSLQRKHLIGLHAQSPEEECQWFAIDIDLHDTEAFDAEEAAQRNFSAALNWWERLQARGYDPLLLDSNGAGGFHLWTLLAEPAPMADVHAFAQEIVADWQTQNLDELPETFPKSGKLSDDKMGAWLRLPGLHHTRDHFTRAWSGDDWLDDPWLDGNEAIELMLRTVPGPRPPSVDPNAEKPASSGSKRRFQVDSDKRPTVCVDLDGVLARYDGWKGVEHFGDPLPGAVEFTRSLAQWADIIIFTARCNNTWDADRDVSAAAELVRTWLEKHGFTFDEIYTGQGKPFATAYIDDRSVSCQPQKDGPAAFLAAEKLARNCGRVGGYMRDAPRN